MISINIWPVKRASKFKRTHGWPREVRRVINRGFSTMQFFKNSLYYDLGSPRHLFVVAPFINTLISYSLSASFPIFSDPTFLVLFKEVDIVSGKIGHTIYSPTLCETCPINLLWIKPQHESDIHNIKLYILAYNDKPKLFWIST